MTRDDDNSINRRKFLRNTTLTAGALAAIPAVGAAKSTERQHEKVSKLDTSFNPSSENETEQFVASTFELSDDLSQAQTDKGTRQLANQLSDKQWEAIADVMQSLPYTTERTQPTSDGQPSANTQDISTSGYSTYPFEFSCFVKIPGYGKVKTYDFRHKIQWAHNGSSISNPEANTTGKGYNYYVMYWNYTGSTRDDINNAGNHFTSEKTGRFKNCIPSGDTLCDTDLAYSKLLGGANGSGSILNYHCEADSG
jgi:hypothetical protein